MKIEQLLAEKGREVHTIRAGADATMAASMMKAHGIASLVVTEDDRVIGLIGERDIVRGVAAGVGTIADRKVQDLMDHHPVTCSPADTITAVMQIMTERRRRHLPVVEDGRLCGVVSIGDMVKLRLNELELESRVLRDAYLSRR